MKPYSLLCTLTAFVMSASAPAQTTFIGSLADLQAEVVRRAELQLHPVTVYDPDVIRRGAALLKSKSEDDWANAWMEIADGYYTDAEQQEGSRRARSGD